MTERREALEALLTSPGWQIVCEEARKEWSRREKELRVKAMEDADNLRAVGKLRQVMAADEAVSWVLDLPDSLLKHEKMRDAAETHIRRPRPEVHPALVGESRRGGL